MKFLILSCLLLFVFGCNQTERKLKSRSESEWTDLEIQVTHGDTVKKIFIIRQEDTCRFSLILKDKEHFLKYKKYDHSDEKFVLSKDEKTQLHRLFVRLFENPPLPKITVSCYGGENIYFTMNKYSNPSLTCSYSSIFNWSEMSSITQGINELTFKKVSEKPF